MPFPSNIYAPDDPSQLDDLTAPEDFPVTQQSGMSSLPPDLYQPPTAPPQLRPDLGPGAYSNNGMVSKPSTLSRILGASASGFVGGVEGGKAGADTAHQMLYTPFENEYKNWAANETARQQKSKELLAVSKEQRETDQSKAQSEYLRAHAKQEQAAADLANRKVTIPDPKKIGKLLGFDDDALSSMDNLDDATKQAVSGALIKRFESGEKTSDVSIMAPVLAKDIGIEPDTPEYTAFQNGLKKIDDKRLGDLLTYATNKSKTPPKGSPDSQALDEFMKNPPVGYQPNPLAFEQYKKDQDAAKADKSQQAAEDRANKKEGTKTVIGVEPETGRHVMLSRADADKAKLENVLEAPQADVSKTLSARQWLPLADKPAQTPDQMGILQLVDELDKKKALGPLASRWNDFLIGKYGGGTGDQKLDQLLESLRTKIGLSQTLLMNLHVGSRGGSYMLEHFQDLANDKKLNANLLRTGIKSELNYATDRAMMPSKTGSTPAISSGSTPTVNSKQDFDSLPSGATFIDGRDGKTKKKAAQ